MSPEQDGAAVSDAEVEAACNAYAQYALDCGLPWGREDGMHRACMEAALTAHDASRARSNDAGWQPTHRHVRFKKIATGLMNAIATPTDELAAKKGEGDMLVQIKRNSDRVRACDRHEFEPVPDWRERKGPFLWLKVTCRRCGGEMKAGDVITYLRGFAHGSGQDETALTSAVFPPAALRPPSPDGPGNGGA